MNRVAGEPGVGFTGQHQRDDQRQFDYRHGQRQHQGAVRLPQPERDELGVVDGNHH